MSKPLTINQLIVNTIRSNNYSKAMIAKAAGISTKKLNRLLSSKNMDFADLFMLSKAIGFRVSIEFSNNDEVYKFQLIRLDNEQTKQVAQDIL